MKRAFLILLAAASVASAQTFITVTADTNRVIRTNFSLVRSQVSDLSGASFAISNITGLQTALDGKLATNGSAAGLSNFPASLLITNGDASGLTNFPSLLLTTNSAESAFPADLLRTNGNAAALTNFPALLLTTNSAESAFPAALLRTNGDGSGLTNLPNADLGSATGILPLANGGTGATNASAARTALELGTAATNDATAFQPANTNLTALAGGDGSSLTNVTITDASTLTNFPAELLRTNGDAAGLTNFPASVLLTNGDAAGLTNFPAELLRTNGDASGLIGVATYPAFSNNAGKVLAVATNEAGVEWLPVSNTVTDASLLTNFPVSLLTTNGDAAGLTNFPAELLRTNGSAAGLTSFPASLLTTNGDASGLTNFPTFNQNTTGTASNVTGVVAVANGGTGASDASNARVNLLPSYTGNENKVLALNSNATEIVWAVDGGGTPDVSTATGVLPVANGGTGTNSASGALVSFGIYPNTSVNHGIQIGSLSSVVGSSVAIGYDADATGGSSSIAIGLNAKTRTNASGAIAIGSDARVSTNSAYGIAIGSNTSISNNTTNAIAIGYTASAGANNAAQIGDGDNTNANTIQFLSAGSVGTSAWSALANSTTFGHYLMAAPTNGTNGQILALNSNATAVVWTNNAAGGGTPDVSTATGVLPVANGGTGGTNALSAFTNLGVYLGNSNSSVLLGANAFITNGSSNVVIGYKATNEAGSGVVIGAEATILYAGATAVGHKAYSQSINSVSIGINSSAYAGSGIAIGNSAKVNGTHAVQLGQGTNADAYTIQFYNYGTVSGNAWTALAEAGTVGTNLMRANETYVAQGIIFPSTTTNAPTNTNAPTPDAWLQISIGTSGTNNFKIPLWK